MTGTPGRLLTPQQSNRLSLLHAMERDLAIAAIAAYLRRISKLEQAPVNYYKRKA